MPISISPSNRAPCAIAIPSTHPPNCDTSATNKMAPPVEPFAAAELPTRVLGDVNGKRRKGIEGLDLEKCEILEILQYSCVVEGSERGQVVRDSRVICKPIERLFRR